MLAYAMYRRLTDVLEKGNLTADSLKECIETAEYEIKVLKFMKTNNIQIVLDENKEWYRITSDLLELNFQDKKFGLREDAVLFLIKSMVDITDKLSK